MYHFVSHLTACVWIGKSINFLFKAYVSALGIALDGWHEFSLWFY